MGFLLPTCLLISCKLLASFTSFSLLQRETFFLLCFECDSSLFPIAQRGSEHSIPIHPLHTSHGFQDTFWCCFFFSQINHLSSISSHRNHLLPFIILAAPFQTFFKLIPPSGRNQNCAEMVEWWQTGVVASGHSVVWYLFLA